MKKADIPDEYRREYIMKKRYLILAGVLALTVAVAGCGKKQNTETQSVRASATPAREITKEDEDKQKNVSLLVKISSL